MKKILVVDDEPHVAIVLKQFLSRSGFTIRSTLNGQLALAAIAQDTPDVIISDVEMPIMGGIEFCETIQADMSQLGKLIIIMTSRTDRNIRTWVRQYDNVELMEKPLSMKRLVIRLNKYFAELDG